MVIDPFEFKVKEIDSAVRFTHFTIERAKAAEKLLRKNREEAEKEIIRLLRAINQNDSNYVFLRQQVSSRRLEMLLIEELKRISRDAAYLIGIYKRKRTFSNHMNLVKKIIDDIKKQEELVDRILKSFEKQVKRTKGVYFAGINSGGFGSRCVIGMYNGKVVGVGEGGPGFPSTIGVHKSIENVIIALKNAARNAGIDFRSAYFERVAVGMAGIGPAFKELNRLFAMYAKKLAPNIKDFILIPDNLAGWYAAFEGEPGIIVIGGTGHNVYGHYMGRDSSFFSTKTRKLEREVGLDQFKRVDVVIGGRNISHKASKILIHQIIKKQRSILMEVIERAYKEGKLFGDSPDLKSALKELYFHYAKDTKLLYIDSDKDTAAMARYVIDAAKLGDPNAIKLLISASHNMGFAVARVAKDIGLHMKHFKVAYFGSLYTRPIVLGKLKRQVKNYEPNAVVVPPKNSEQKGLLLIAIRNPRFY